MSEVNTHGVELEFGKHKGELVTRVPVSYLKFMINNNTPQAIVAKAELARRGDTLPKVELSGHAINNASLRVRWAWHEYSEKGEGLYSWLERMTLEALEHGERLESGKIKYKQMKFVIAEGEEFPSLKTIMPASRKFKKIIKSDELELDSEPHSDVNPEDTRI